MTSAETGHLILGTLHTASAAKTIDRIVDVFPAEQQAQIRTQLASTLVGVISQALIPRIDGPGMCVACEVMMANPSIKKYILTGKTESIYQTIQTSKFEGMQTMEQSFVQLCKEGKVNFDVAEPYLKGYSKYEFQHLIKGGSATEVESEEKYYNRI
jgi:twitching motility protein PilT